MRSAIALIALSLVSACADTQTVAYEDEDAGGLVCGVGQVARFGRCYCQNDSACPSDQYCEGVTGTCQPRPQVTEPDGGPQLCTSGARRCSPDNKAVQECQNGFWDNLETCPAAGHCAADATGYYCTVCSSGVSECKDANTSRTCTEKGDGWTETACVNPDSQAPSQCINGHCQICTPAATRCSADGKFLETCADDGTAWNRAFCSVTGKCDSSSGAPACVPPACQPGQRRCKAGSSTEVEICRDDGSGYDAKACSAVDQFSTPTATCDSRINDCVDPCGTAARNASYQGCEYWTAVLANSEGLEPVFRANTAVGAQGTTPSDFAIVVSNPNASAVNVKVQRYFNGAEEIAPSAPAAVGGVISVAAGSLQVIKLPWQEVEQTGKARYAYHVTTDLPVSAYQFNPLNAAIGNTYSYTNDASLLLPAHILAGSYVVIANEHETSSYPSNIVVPCATDYDCDGPGNACSGYDPRLGKYCKASLSANPGLMAVVATQDNTQVKLRFSAAVKRSRDGSIPAQAIGSTATYTLQRYEVLQVFSDIGGIKTCANTAGPNSPDQMCKYTSDLTGTIVASDKPVAVFGGARCAFKPSNAFACDHLEEQMMPFETWGKTYVGLKSAPYKHFEPPFIFGNGTWSDLPVTSRGPDYWRIVAGCGASSCPNGTKVTISPPPTSVVSGNCTNGVCTLPAIGGTQAFAPFIEISHSGSFTVAADQPVMVAQYFGGEDSSPTSSEGDPSLVLTPPIEQWRREYNVLASPTLIHNYLSVVGPTVSPNAKIDGQDAASFPGVVTGTLPGGYTYFQVPVSGGSHKISATAKVGVTVYGYDEYVSYGYTGGLDLTRITSINPGG